VGERQILGPELVQQTTEKIQKIQERIRTAQSRQKSYADKRRRDLEFEVGDRVYLKVTPQHLTTRGKKKGKLRPRFIGPYPVKERVGPLAYRLELPISLSNIHDVFHVSQLRKYIPDPTQEIQVEVIELKDDLTYPESPERILDRRDQVLRNKIIPLVKIQWRNHTEEEATWELEGTIREKYPYLFEDMERE